MAAQPRRERREGGHTPSSHSGENLRQAEDGDRVNSTKVSTSQITDVMPPNPIEAHVIAYQGKMLMFEVGKSQTLY